MLCDACRVGKCPTCGGPMIQTRGVGHVYRYCSYECRNKGRKGIPLKGKVIVSCEVCGERFPVFPSRVGETKYCSKKCGRVGMSKSLSAAGLKLRADPAYRAAQSTRTAASWLDIEKRAKHLESVRTPEHRRLRSKIGKEQWEAPDCKARVALRTFLDSPKFHQSMLMRKLPAWPKWTSYVDSRGTEHRFRSSWEADWAKWFDYLGLEWKYEPKRFDLGPHRLGVYTPDFHVQTPFGACYVEAHRMETIRPGDEKKVAKLKKIAAEGILDLPLVLMGESQIKGMRKAMREREIDSGKKPEPMPGEK